MRTHRVRVVNLSGGEKIVVNVPAENAAQARYVAVQVAARRWQSFNIFVLTGCQATVIDEYGYGCASETFAA